MARQILALYSPMSQSGKSTTLKLLSEILREENPGMSIATLKISGGIKRITGVALSLVLPAEEDPQDYVDGPKKEEAVPLLGEVGHGRLIEAMVGAALAWAGYPRAMDAPYSPLPEDSPFGAVTPLRMKQDLVAALGEGLVAAGIARVVDLPREAQDPWPALSQASSRLIQQVLGREWKRRYNERLWSEATASLAQDLDVDLVVVDDMRYPADYEDLVAAGAMTLRLNRPAATGSNSHPSEGLLEDRAFDARIENDRDLPHLRDQVASLLAPALLARLETRDPEPAL